MSQVSTGAPVPLRSLDSFVAPQVTMHADETQADGMMRCICALRAAALRLPHALVGKADSAIQSAIMVNATSVGTRHVTLHRRDAVVGVDAAAFNRLKGARTGELLIEALQASPHRKIEVESRRSAMPVRAVKL